MIDLNLDLLKQFKEKTSIKFKKFDIQKCFHCSIAHTDIKEKFEDIWNFLLETKEPKFKIMFDNITILKNVEGTWKIHKEFFLN